MQFPELPSNAQQDRIRKLCSSRDIEGWIEVLSFVMNTSEGVIKKEHVYRFIRGGSIVILLGCGDSDPEHNPLVDERLEKIESNKKAGVDWVSGRRVAKRKIPKPEIAIKAGNSYAHADSYTHAYCCNCHKRTPFVFSYQNKITGAATFDLGGPVNLTRVITSTEQTTHCSICGYRVYTKSEMDQREADAEREDALWKFMWFFIILCIFIGVIAISNANIDWSR